MEYKNNRDKISEYIHAKQVSQENIDSVLELARVRPTRYEFLVYLRMLLVWVGAISLVMALLFFMAFNWNELGRFAKFIMVEVVMIMAVLSYLFLDKYKLLQQVSLMLGSITLGVFLALIGQTYQTGADPWQLFAVWAFLMTPWAVVASFSGLWILWILLINLAILLYFQKLDLSPWAILQMQDNLLLLAFALNSFLWIMWEVLGTKYEAFKNQISVKFLAFLTVASITVLAILNLYIHIDEMTAGETNTYYFTFYALTMGVIYYVYRVRKLNIYMLSLFSFSLFVFVLNIFILFIVNSYGDFFGILILMIIFIMIVTTLIVSWLKKLRKELK